MSKNDLPFQRTNYIIMLVGIGLIILGFIFMANDSDQHGFGFLGLTLGPIVVLLGFFVQFFAITHKKKTRE